MVLEKTTIEEKCQKEIKNLTVTLPEGVVVVDDKTIYELNRLLKIDDQILIRQYKDESIQEYMKKYCST